jgi:ABC-2 type transport system permease protein
MTAATMAVQAAPRPFYWSVRRELWEHRSVYLGPAIAAGVVLFGFILSLMQMSHVHWEGSNAGVDLTILPYFVVSGVVLATGLLVAFAYCLSALNTERRDRSILFWKSLPVSDATTVLAKAFVPLVAIPVVAFAVIGVTQLIVMVMLAISPHAQGQGTGQVGQAIFSSLIYGPLVLSLWYAPVYGWLLLVSSWAKRGTFLWAVLPPLAICLLEAIVLHSRHFSDLLGLRLNGGFGAVFALSAPASADQFHLSQITREQFFTSPDLWLGLLVAAAFIAGAVWMRRRAEPV